MGMKKQAWKDMDKSRRAQEIGGMVKLFGGGTKNTPRVKAGRDTIPAEANDPG